MISSCFKKLIFRLRILQHGRPNGGPCFWSPGGNKSKGVGIVCNVSLNFEDLEVKRDMCGHLVNAKFPTRKLFTRHNKSNTNMSRIDRIYAPKDMISDAFGYTFNPCSYSDHDLVSVNFQCKQTAPHGPGLWKFNSSLTQDDDYTGLLSQFLQDWKLQKGRYPDLQTWWDAGKCHI